LRIESARNHLGRGDVSHSPLEHLNYITNHPYPQKTTTAIKAQPFTYLFDIGSNLKFIIYYKHLFYYFGEGKLR
jgi:hypothetical protein